MWEKFFRMTHRMFSVKNGVLRNLAYFAGKHLCWNVFLVSYVLEGLHLWKESPTQMLSVLKNICKWLLLNLANLVEYLAYRNVTDVENLSYFHFVFSWSSVLADLLRSRLSKVRSCLARWINNPPKHFWI